MAKQDNVIWVYAAPQPALLWRRLADRVAAFFLGLGQWRRDCYELRMFLAMEDGRFLRDIGVNRYDVRQELRRPFWDWAARDS